MTDDYVPGHGDASWAASHYALDLGYRPDGNRLTGEAVITGRTLEDVRWLDVDLAYLRVRKLLLDGAPVKYTHRSHRIRVRASLRAGTEFTLTIKYDGSPRPLKAPDQDSAGWEELEDGVIVASQPHGAPTWYPCNDRPSNKATYAVSIDVPADYYVAFSGEETASSRSGSTRHFEFEQTVPMASYLASVQIGRYERRRQKAGVPLSVVAPPALKDLGGFVQQPEMMALFSQLFGPYPFSSYTAVITDDELEIPLESQALSTFGSNFCDDEWQSNRLIAHEMAHQWFGNAVTSSSWRDIWLHEGFACYAEWLWSEEAGLESCDERARHHYDGLADKPQDLVIGDPGAELMFDDRVYKRGALTLHALRVRLGDEKFFELLRLWVRTHAGGNVTTADFRTLCDSVVDVDDIFDDWVYSESLPDFPA